MDADTRTEEAIFSAVDELALKEANPGIDPQLVGKMRSALPRDWRYREFFFALKFSPSYDIASKIAAGEMLGSNQVLPADFALVQDTHRRFGDVRRVEFAPWWFMRARRHFGSTEAGAVALMRVEQHPSLNARELDEFKEAVSNRPHSPAEGPGLLVALPLRGDPDQVLAEVRRLLEEEAAKEQGNGFRFAENSVRRQTVAHARRLLCARIIAPGHPLYVIGNRVGVSPVNEHDASKPRHEVLDQRRTVEILTSRHLRRAYNLCEQAARGRFPCLDALEGDRKLWKKEQRDQRLDFDYPALLRRVTDHFTWLSSRLAALAGDGRL